MTPQDLQRIRDSRGWREHRVEVFHDTSQGSVLVKGQRAPRPAWRYQLLNVLARAIGMPLLRAAPVLGGASAQHTEVRRLRDLALAGVAVPEVLHVEDQFFVQRWLGERRLDAVLQTDAAEALQWWRRGLRSLVELHAHGQYLSQAFARNFIVCGDALAMIDFEDDPLQVMSLDQAQARDWLAYLHSSARWLHGAGNAAATEMLRAELAGEREPVRRLVADTARRLAWVRRLHATPGARGWQRHVAILRAAVDLASAAAIDPTEQSTPNPEVPHARHH